MSTWEQIKLVGEEAGNKSVLCKHQDGYPDDILPILEPFAERFFKEKRPLSEFVNELLAEFRTEERRYRDAELEKAKEKVLAGQAPDWRLEHYSDLDFTDFGINQRIQYTDYIYLVSSRDGRVRVVHGLDFQKEEALAIQTRNVNVRQRAAGLSPIVAGIQQDLF